MKRMRLLFGTIVASLFVVVSAAIASVDLNTASETELTSLPGVGEKMAKDIMAARPFKSVEDLKNVKGIGDSKFKKLKEMVSVSSSSRTDVKEEKKSSRSRRSKKDEKEITKEQTSSTSSSTSSVVDLNTANQKELEALPGVGEKMAKDIVAARPFKSVDDLKNVKGIGDSKFEKMRPFVSVSSSGSTTSSTSATTASPASEQKKSVFGSLFGRKKAEPKDEELDKEDSHQSANHLAPGEVININTASQEQLERLPGVGPKRAQLIMDARPFKNKEDIMKVKGIKEGIFHKIENNISTN